MNRVTLAIRCLTFVLTVLVSSEAAAASGFLKGIFKVWNQNGNYCNSSVQDCTGSYYPISLYDTAQPYANSYIEVFQGSNLIGFSSTADNGWFVVGWNSSDVVTPVRIRAYALQKDSRFFVGDTSGNLWFNASGAITLVPNTTIASPQNTGTWTIGSSASPAWYANVFWAEELQYRSNWSLVQRL